MKARLRTMIAIVLLLPMLIAGALATIEERGRVILLST